MRILLFYLLAANIAVFFLYGIDKYKTKRGMWRISEATLLTMAAIGGSVGAWLGMSLWHHKTKHRKFAIGVPLVLALQIALAIYLHIKAWQIAALFGLKCREKKMIRCCHLMSAVAPEVVVMLSTEQSLEHNAQSLE